MAQYRVLCSFTVVSELILEASDERSARDKAYADSPLPPRDQWEYLHGSFEVDEIIPSEE